jgi:hypothetical protein
VTLVPGDVRQRADAEAGRRGVGVGIGTQRLQGVPQQFQAVLGFGMGPQVRLNLPLRFRVQRLEQVTNQVFVHGAHAS